MHQWAKEVTKWLGSERLSAVALLQSPDAPRIVAEFQVQSAGDVGTKCAWERAAVSGI